MWSRLVIEGNAVYEIDDECEKRNRKQKEQQGFESKSNKRRRGSVSR